MVKLDNPSVNGFSRRRLSLAHPSPLRPEPAVSLVQLVFESPSLKIPANLSPVIAVVIPTAPCENRPGAKFDGSFADKLDMKVQFPDRQLNFGPGARSRPPGSGALMRFLKLLVSGQPVTNT